MVAPTVCTERWTELARTSTAAGDGLVLRERAGIVELRCNGWELMSNRAHHSETALSVLACEAMRDVDTDSLEAHSPRQLLIAGLGFGYTLRAALDHLPQSARVTVAELLPDIIAWNRGPLAPLAGHPLTDPRVSVICADIAALLRAANPATLDAILLDTDNGPDAVLLAGNASLYTPESLRMIRKALRPAGILGVWSADPSPRFEHHLQAAGFLWRAIDVPARGSPEDPLHTIYLAHVAAER
jgi:spermidine synthase